jgi:hypothetical protein
MIVVPFNSAHYFTRTSFEILRWGRDELDDQTRRELLQNPGVRTIGLGAWREDMFAAMDWDPDE